MAPKATMKHPLTKQVYTLTDDGFVEVVDPESGKKGVFDVDGTWQSGEIKNADLQMLGWVGRRGRLQGDR